MCSGSEAGSYFRLIDFVYHSTLGWRVIKKKRRTEKELAEAHAAGAARHVSRRSYSLISFGKSTLP